MWFRSSNINSVLDEVDNLTTELDRLVGLKREEAQALQLEADKATAEANRGGRIHDKLKDLFK